MSRAPTAEELVAKYGKRLDRGPRCDVETSGKSELIEKLLTMGVTAARIQIILRDEFHVAVGHSTIRRHAVRLCRCRR